MGSPIPGAEGDPLPAPPISENVWATVAFDDTLVYLDGDLVLQRVAGTGNFRLYRFDRSAANGADPLPGPPLTQGTWTTVDPNDRIVYLGSDRILVWTPSSGRYRVWALDRNARGNADPLPGVPQTNGIWASIGSGHDLIALGDGRVIDWERGSGKYHVWRHDPGAVGAADPLPGPALTTGTWSSIGAGHELISFGENRVLDRETLTGRYRFWHADPAAVGDPLSADPVVSGQWTSIADDRRLFYFGGDRALDLKTDGRFRVWRFDRNITTLRRARVVVHLRILQQPESATIADLVSSMKAVFGSYGFDVQVPSIETIDVIGTNDNRFLLLPIDQCRRGQPTPQQIDLFNHRAAIDPKEIVVFFVRELIPDSAGCSSHPPGRPGAVVASRDITKWTLAHEVAHVLGLNHEGHGRTDLMIFGTFGLRDPPPDFSTDDINVMLASELSQK